MIFHLALHAEWREVVDRGEAYQRSTLGKSLADVGFIHCSFADQVQSTADLSYRGRDDVVLLTIDVSRLESEVRVEQSFPHVHGPLPIGAVIGVTPVPPGRDGRLAIPAAIIPGA